MVDIVGNVVGMIVGYSVPVVQVIRGFSEFLKEAPITGSDEIAEAEKITKKLIQQLGGGKPLVLLIAAAEFCDYVVSECSTALVEYLKKEAEKDEDASSG